MGVQIAPQFLVPRRKTFGKVYFYGRCDLVNYNVLLHFTDTVFSVGSVHTHCCDVVGIQHFLCPDFARRHIVV